MSVTVSDPSVKSTADLDALVDYRFYQRGTPKTVAIRGFAAWRLSGYAPDTLRGETGEESAGGDGGQAALRDEL